MAECSLLQNVTIYRGYSHAPSDWNMTATAQSKSRELSQGDSLIENKSFFGLQRVPCAGRYTNLPVRENSGSEPRQADGEAE